MDIRMARKIFFSAAEICVVILIACFVYTVYASTDRISDVEPHAVEAAVLEGTVPDGAVRGTDLDVRRVFDVDTESFDGIIYYMPVSNMDVTELVIARTDSAELRGSLVESINSRLEAQKSVFEGYAPEQYNILDSAVVAVKGNYVFYAAAKDADEYYERFLDVI